jgi:copper chaperone CopZ
MRLFAVAPLVALAAVGGCAQAGTGSSGSFSGQAKDVATVISNLSSDGQRRKESDICDTVLSQALRAKVAQGGQDCASEMKKAIEDADGFSLDVQSVDVTGNTATARVKSTDRDRDVVRTFKLVKERGDWRVDSFG